MPRLTIVVAAAGAGRRPQEHGPKSLIPLTARECVLARQLRLLGEAYPRAELVVVVGHGAERVLRALKPGAARVVENERYEETNVVRSLGLALRVAAGHSLLVVYGDLVFNRAAVEGLTRYGPSVVAESLGQLPADATGLTVQGRHAAHFDFGLPLKWGRIAYLAGPELESFASFVGDPDNAKSCGFEALNHVVDGGGRLRAVQPEGARLIEIDTPGSIEEARSLASRRSR